MKTLSPIELCIGGNGTVFRNLTARQLVETAVKNGEGVLSNTGALVVNTGKYTGRSPDDKYIVDTPSIHDDIAWGSVNRPISKENFDSIKNKMLAYLQNRQLYVFDGFAGADKKYAKSFRIINELASQNLFIKNLLVDPSEEDLDNFVPEFTVIAAPGFKCIPEIDGTNSEACIAIDYEQKLVIIAGSQYSGEIKKSVFSVMNLSLIHILAETTLTDIEWNTSRTGRINPVAVFEPVDIEGSTVNRASVHNVSVLESLKLGVGDRIKVYKANMIIPQIAENLTCSATAEIPKICPVCRCV